MTHTIASSRPRALLLGLLLTATVGCGDSSGGDTGESGATTDDPGSSTAGAGGTADATGTSAGPTKTRAASGIKDFGKLLSRVADASPLRRNVTIEDVGNVAAFLLSDLASGMTAEITYVDGGFSQTAGLSADQV